MPKLSSLAPVSRLLVAPTVTVPAEGEARVDFALGLGDLPKS